MYLNKGGHDVERPPHFEYRFPVNFPYFAYLLPQVFEMVPILSTKSWKKISLMYTRNPFSTRFIYHNP